MIRNTDPLLLQTVETYGLSHFISAHQAIKQKQDIMCASRTLHEQPCCVWSRPLAEPVSGEPVTEPTTTAETVVDVNMVL